MNAELSRLLAQALKERSEAEAALVRLAGAGGSSRAAQTHAERYVHEQRVVNRIICEARDE